MRTRSTTIIAAGVLIAVVGGLTVLAYARSLEGRTASGEMVSAFTVDRDVTPGTKGEDVARIMQEVAVPAVVRPGTAVAAPGDLVGRIAVRSISKGEVITADQFGAQATGAAPAAGLQIPPGHNALTVNLPLPQGVARYVQPGDLVNVYATLGGQASSRTDGPTTKMILSNVQVLSNSAYTPGGKLSTTTSGDVLLTVALRPADAEKLIFAKENGSVWLGLVHPGDGPTATAGQTAGTVAR